MRCLTVAVATVATVALLAGIRSRRSPPPTRRSMRRSTRSPTWSRAPAASSRRRLRWARRSVGLGAALQRHAAHGRGRGGRRGRCRHRDCDRSRRHGDRLRSLPWPIPARHAIPRRLDDPGALAVLDRRRGGRADGPGTSGARGQRVRAGIGRRASAGGCCCAASSGAAARTSPGTRSTGSCRISCCG